MQEMVNRYYGLRATDIRVMAFQLAIRNNIPHQFSDKGIVGKMVIFFKTASTGVISHT